MPAESKTVVSPPKLKPSTRSSIRQSLNLASVSKAFVDAISKDGREASKNAKKTKDASRRSSVIPPATPRLSMGDLSLRPSSQVSRRTGTPESKTVTRRRVSASYARSSSDEQSSKPTEPSTPPSAVLPRATTLRPRNLNATAGSALPKYRPKSALVEPAKPPSPVRSGVRRRLSTSDEEKKDQNRPQTTTAQEEKTSRPISPLPQRAALKANLTNSVNATPPSTPSMGHFTPSAPAKASPSRPTKIVKTSAVTSVPRPPSSSSSAPSLHLNATPKRSTPKVSTPKASSIKSKLGQSHSSQDKSGGSPFKVLASPYSRDSPSPSERHVRNNSKLTTSASSMASGNMSHISEGTSEREDSDEEDVELLLAPVAAPGAPTPAMPRIQASRKRLIPQTPTRLGLPTRDKLSYVSPMPPDSEQKSGSFLRPPRQTTNGTAARGSILSWEQLANESSRSLGEDEFGRMLADIPAPFRSGAVSPSLSSQMDVPESPCLSAIDSPGGYGSISQVLLPDVTPSPAMHHAAQQARFNLPSDAAATADASTVTFLRLQLAQVENTAKERLFQMQGMEEEIHNLKQAHALQMEEAQKHMAYMEAQGRASDEKASYVASLEEQLFRAQLLHDQALEEAVAHVQESAERDRVEAEMERCRLAVVESATLAASKWDTVRSACEVELDLVRGDRELLALLLAQVEQLSQPL